MFRLTDPFARSSRGLLSEDRQDLSTVIHQMHLVNPDSIAGSKDGSDIVLVVDVFEDDGEIVLTVRNGSFDTLDA